MPIVISDFPSKASTLLIFFGWAGKMGILCLAAYFSLPPLSSHHADTAVTFLPARIIH